MEAHGFENVLFCPLGDEHNLAALRRVERMLEESEGRLTIMGVVPDPSPLERMLHPASQLERIADAARTGERKRLSAWEHRLGPEEIDVMVGSGSPAIAIVEQVLGGDHDLVVVTSDEDREDAATIKRLWRKCPAPVWVIRPTRARKLRVMAAVNPEPDELDLNLAILNVAATMQRVQGGELHVVHAWQLYGEATMRHSAFMHVDEAEIEGMVEAEAVARADELNHLLSHPSIAAAPWQRHLYKGPAADGVIGAVDMHHINLLVLGTVARTGLPGLVMGNTAETILDRVTCSVVAVKPPGFQSPVQLDG